MDGSRTGCDAAKLLIPTGNVFDEAGLPGFAIMVDTPAAIPQMDGPVAHAFGPFLA